MQFDFNFTRNDDSVLCTQFKEPKAKLRVRLAYYETFMTR